MKKIKLSQPILLSASLIIAYLVYYGLNFTTGINDAVVDLFAVFK